MDPNSIVEEIKRRFECEVELHSRSCGRKKMERHNVFARIKREDFRKFIDFLFEIQDYPHFSVISATDLGNSVELLYHFTVGYGEMGGEVVVTAAVNLPKEDLRIETITDRIPGALISEREIHEMVGVEFTGLKDTRHFFLDENWPEGKYPWRRDDTFPEEMLNRLYETWRSGKGGDGDE